MDIDSLLGRLLADHEAPTLPLEAPLPQDVAAVLVERLKQEADRHWYIDANRSFELAGRIVQIGQAQGNLQQIALGTMARGDALKFLGRLEEAWAALGEAGTLYQQASDEVGWARTRIGRLFICADLNRVGEALADAELANAIFTRRGEHEMLLRLKLNTAVVYSYHLGDHQRALTLCHAALAIAEALGEPGARYLATLHTNIGLAHNYLGELQQALIHYERALAIFTAQQETSSAAIVELNIAYVAQAQGRYRRALELLHRVEPQLAAHRPIEAAWARRDIVECYLMLNRYAESRDLAEQLVSDLRRLGAAYEAACTLLHLATAEAELAHYGAAQAALDEAEPIFASLGARMWSAMVHLRRGQIALRQGSIETALHDAQAAMTEFAADSEQAYYASAILLQAEAQLALGDPQAANQAAHRALRIAQQRNIPSLRYSAHLLLGRVGEARRQPNRTLRHYRAATATVERMQRGLTITLRPGFLAEKGEALRALIRLHLQAGRVTSALEDLERVKSQVLLGYLTHRETLRWAQDDPQNRLLIEELDRLRAEHHWLYQMAHDPSARHEDRPNPLPADQALKELATRERRMRAITERLYLQTGDRGDPGLAVIPSLGDIQRELAEDSVLIEYYNDGRQLWAFTLDRRSLEVHALTITADVLNRLLSQLQFNVACALRLDPHARASANLAALAQQIASQLYGGLLAPFAGRIQDRRRLVVVPYGALHYLPFHALHTGQEYLAERYEVVILPAAGLATRSGPRRTGGALVLSHSRDGQLEQTRSEGQMVNRLFGGEFYADDLAGRSVLQAQPRQILHIAAHGEFRIDQPDLSYIQLAGGPVFADDLLQCDLGYELVTLSACETGRAVVSGGEELIGLGRGFLYAGAGALVTSLWRVDDSLTLRLMETMYRELLAGASKAEALRSAQHSLLQENRQLHAAFWGAFQLVGNAEPLSSHPVSM